MYKRQLLLLFVAVLLLLNMGQLMRTDWEHFSLLDNGITLSAYNFITRSEERRVGKEFSFFRKPADLVHKDNQLHNLKSRLTYQQGTNSRKSEISNQAVGLYD